MAEQYRVEWTYEGSPLATYNTFDLAGAERYRARVAEDPIAQDVRIVEVGPQEDPACQGPSSGITGDESW